MPGKKKGGKKRRNGGGAKKQNKSNENESQTQTNTNITNNNNEDPFNVGNLQIVSDTNGNKYQDLNEMWTQFASDSNQWYKKADDYWKGVKPDVDGMLGGFGHISDTDIKGSKEFLADLATRKQPIKLQLGRVLDVGSGIGRISKLLFVPLGFKKIDLMDQNQKLLEEAKTFISKEDVVDNLFCSGMQSFQFTQTYDLIWTQWVSIYLTDKDFVDFFERCRKALNPGGLLVIKENVSNHGFLVDNEDNSITRTDDHVRTLLRKAGFHIAAITQQVGFPKELFPVKMYAAVQPTPEMLNTNSTTTNTNNNEQSKTNANNDKNEQQTKSDNNNKNSTENGTKQEKQNQKQEQEEEEDDDETDE